MVNFESIKKQQATVGREQEFSAWFKQLQYLNYRTAFEEKHSRVNDEDWPILHSGDWEQFSKNRGYSSAEIETFRSWLEFVERGLIYGLTSDDICELLYDPRLPDYDVLWAIGYHPAQRGYTFDSYLAENPNFFQIT